MRSALVVLLLVACSGEESEPAAPSTTGAERPAPERPREPRPDDPTPPPPTEAMTQQLIGQRVLDHERVRPFLHAEVAGNLPLTVYAVDGLAQGAPRMRAGGRPVAVTDAAESARFRFTSRESLGGARVRVGFEIPAEGVVGSVVLELRDYEWRVESADVVER